MKILITGTSSGIGQNLAEDLLQQGQNIVGISRNTVEFTGNYQHYNLDLKDLSEQHLKILAKEQADLDVLILNAGYGEFKELEQFSREQIFAMFQVNILSNILLVKELLPKLRNRKNAKIIFIGSEAAKRGAKKGTIYAATKFALQGFAESLRQEVASSNLAVTIINPGMVKTKFYEKLFFAPGKSVENSIKAADLSKIINLTIALENNLVLDEINLSPMKKNIFFKK